MVEGRSASPRRSVVALVRKANYCSVHWGRPLVTLTADIWRCFDHMRHRWLDWALQSQEVKAWLRRAIMREYQGLEAAARLMGSDYTDPFPFQRGAPTGRPEGPALLNVLVEALMGPVAALWEEKG